MKNLSFAEMHICGGRDGLETEHLLCRRFFYFLEKIQTKTFFVWNWYIKTLQMQFGTTPWFDETKKKVPISEFQPCGTDDSRKTFQLLTLSQDENKCWTTEISQRKEILLS